MKPTPKPPPKKLKLSLKKTTVAQLGADQLDKVAAAGLVTDGTCTFCVR